DHLRGPDPHGRWPPAFWRSPTDQPGTSSPCKATPAVSSRRATSAGEAVGRCARKRRRACSRCRAPSWRRQGSRARDRAARDVRSFRAAALTFEHLNVGEKEERIATRDARHLLGGELPKLLRQREVRLYYRGDRALVLADASLCVLGRTDAARDE